MEVVIINLNEVKKEVETLSKEVGQYQLKKFNEKLNVTQKTSYLDLVSEVDKNSEEKIVSWTHLNNKRL